MESEKLAQNGCNGKTAVDVDRERLRKQLTPIQYRVTQEAFTERPFTGEYLKLNASGMYCCVVCGEELFSSECKYDSGCGWPAFYDVINSDKVKLSADVSHVGSNLLLLALRSEVARTECSCAKCGAHLGHLFRDGPKPTGMRYCVNSASLKFHGDPKSEAENSVAKKVEDINGEPNIDTKNRSSNKIKFMSNGCGPTNGKADINQNKKILMETHL